MDNFMEGLRIALFIFISEIIGVSVTWMIHCIITGKGYLVIEKLKLCLDIFRYLGQYWFDIFCLALLGMILAGKAVIRSVWIVGAIIMDYIRAIIGAVKSTIEIISIIIKWSRKRHAVKKKRLGKDIDDAIKFSSQPNDNGNVIVA